MENRITWISQEGSSETSDVLGSMKFEVIDCKMEPPEPNTGPDIVHEPQCFGDQPVTSSSSEYIKEDPELTLGVNANDDTAEADKMEAERTLTAQYVFLTFTRLVKHCAPVASDTAAMSSLKYKLRSVLREKFVPHILQKVAAFLWPQFRRLKMMTQEERNEVHTEVRKLWAIIPFEDDVAEPVIRSRPKRSRDDGYDEWRDSDEEEDDEIGAYLRDSPGDDQDLLKWWQSKEHRYPKLANVARKILGIPATSTSLECMFSSSRRLLVTRRSSIFPTDVDNILFFNSYLRSVQQSRNQT